MPRVNALILQRANHLEPGAIAHVREPRIRVPAKIPLQHPAILRAVENGSPLFEFAHAGRRLLRMKLRQPPLIEKLAAAHRVAEMHLPAIARLDIRQRRRHAPLGHHRMRLAEQRLAHQRRLRPLRRSLDRRPNPAPPAPTTTTSYSNV